VTNPGGERREVARPWSQQVLWLPIDTKLVRVAPPQAQPIPFRVQLEAGAGGWVGLRPAEGQVERRGGGAAAGADIRQPGVVSGIGADHQRQVIQF
jgi:hypothetical protein